MTDCLWGPLESAVVPMPKWSYNNKGRQWVSGHVLIKPTEILNNNLEFGSNTFLKLMGSWNCMKNCMNWGIVFFL